MPEVEATTTKFQPSQEGLPDRNSRYLLSPNSFFTRPLSTTGDNGLLNLEKSGSKNLLHFFQNLRLLHAVASEKESFGLASDLTRQEFYLNKLQTLFARTNEDGPNVSNLSQAVYDMAELIVNQDQIKKGDGAFYGDAFVLPLPPTCKDAAGYQLQLEIRVIGSSIELITVRNQEVGGQIFPEVEVTIPNVWPEDGRLSDDIVASDIRTSSVDKAQKFYPVDRAEDYFKLMQLQLGYLVDAVNYMTAPTMPTEPSQDNASVDAA